ncbi:conserved unknown protein [Ectocarpus siliculosus]|uniref:Uncharacterized protein n=1 Tax=Ectocarpus siliculosus TaxID=2880 RepID=D7G3S0_ECTSI|nr:conserved unknown protein [Ectocarpus siliculosus]|eukprot:CBJ33597.1 conserved unknown protein [Ectocarpus siliculosus]
MCAYRLGRPSNIVEAFHPLSEKELDVLRSTHPFWDKNMDESFEDTEFTHRGEHVTGKDGLGEEHEWAYRLIVERSKTFYSYLTPVIINACGTRDPFEFPALALSSLDTNHVSHTRCYDKLLDKVMKGSPSLDIVKGVLKECERFFQKARTGRDGCNAERHGALGGEGRKSRRDRVILQPDAEDRKFTLLMAFQMSMGEKVRPLMEAVLRHSPDFELRAATCLMNANLESGSFSVVVGEDHLLGRTPQEKKEGKAWIAGVVKGLKEDVEEWNCQDWCRFSVVTQLGCLFNAACLRQKPALNLSAKTAYYNNDQGRIAMRPPKKGKQHRTANKRLDTVLKEHEIHGADVVRWVMVMSLVGRAFLREDNNGVVDESFGPLNSNGTQITADTFGKIFKVMRAYFGVDNADVYSLRTAHDSQAVKDLLAVGGNTDHPAMAELAREQQTGGDNLVGAYCTYQFDRVAPQVKEKVDLHFKGGLRCMGVEKRKREDLPEFPDSDLWHIPEFVDKVRAMMEMTPPKVPEKVIKDFGDDTDDDLALTAPASSSMSIEPKSGDGCAPPPHSGGPSYGGPSYPIDAEEAMVAKRVRMKTMLLEEEKVDEMRAAIRARRALSSVPAAVGGGVDTSGAATASVDSGPAADSGESSKSAASASRRGMSYNKNASNKVSERDVRDALARQTRGQTEWGTPAGSIDVFTRDEVIEIKHFKNWKSGVGQVKAYGEHHPSHKQRLHLFAHEGEKALKYFEMATRLCAKDGIRVTFEEAVSGSDSLGIEVVDGADVFGKSVADATGLPVVPGDFENLERGGAPSAHVASEPVSAAQTHTVDSGARPAVVIGGRDDVGAGGAAVATMDDDEKALAKKAMKSGGAFPGAGGDKKAVGKRTIDAVHGNGRGPGGAKMEYSAGKPKDDICAGMKTLVEAIGQAYERAKAEGGNKKVLARRNHKKDGRPKRAKIGLVNWLVANDDEFNPGHSCSSSISAAAAQQQQRGSSTAAAHHSSSSSRHDSLAGKPGHSGGEGNGGAVYMYAGELQDEPSTISGCNFSDNVAEEAGGAVKTLAGFQNIFSCHFEGNSADVGGAMRLGGEATVSDCAFLDNIAHSRGLAVDVVESASIHDSTFNGNQLSCGKGWFRSDTEQEDPNARFETVCVDCPAWDECFECIIADGTITPTCEVPLEHTSADEDGLTLETLKLDEGYWRATTESVIILACYNADACAGGKTGADSFCASGYQGPYCAVCETDYSSSLAHTCKHCSSSRRRGLTVIAAIAVIVTVLAFAAVFQYMLSTEHEEGIFGCFRRRVLGAVPVESLKIIVVVWQILTQFADAANVTFPGLYQDFLSAIDVINFDIGSVLAAGCLWSDMDFHDRLLVNTIGPLVVAGFLAMTYGIVIRRHSASADTGGLEKIYHKHQTALLFLTFVVYSSVSSTVFQTFACETLDDDVEYLRADYRIHCTDAKHKAFKVYAAIMIVVYPVGIPLLYALLLFQRRHVLADAGADKTVALSISGLWEPYRPERFYYEVVECGRRVMLTGVVVFIFPNDAAQIAITMLITSFFSLLFEILSPYESESDMWLSRGGHVIVFLSMFDLLLLKVDVSGESNHSQAIFSRVFVAGHVLMILVIVVEVVGICYASGKKRVVGAASSSESSPGLRPRAGSDDVPALESVPASWASFMRQGSVSEEQGGPQAQEGRRPRAKLQSPTRHRRSSGRAHSDRVARQRDNPQPPRYGCQ